MNKVLEEISKIGIVPVIALDHEEDAAPLAKALCDGGLPCAEVTFRTAAAEESIRILSLIHIQMCIRDSDDTVSCHVDTHISR